jgi:hypothetical protein
MLSVISIGPPSFGAYSPQRALNDGMLRLVVHTLLLPSTRWEVVFSGDIFVKVLLPRIALIISASALNSLEGGHRVA